MASSYKLLKKAIAIRLGQFLRKLIHPCEAGFVGDKSIYDNILSVQLGMKYAQTSKQDMVLLQLDFAKAFDIVKWEAIVQIMWKMDSAT